MIIGMISEIDHRMIDANFTRNTLKVSRFITKGKGEEDEACVSIGGRTRKYACKFSMPSKFIESQQQYALIGPYNIKRTTISLVGSTRTTNHEYDLSII